MALTSLYKIAEQCKILLDKGAIQDYVASVQDAYSSLVRRSWFENKSVDVNEVAGAFIITFKDNEPVLDESISQYYIELPSSYLDVPEESGIVYVGFAKGQDAAFVLTNAGTWARLMSIKAGAMGNRQLYYVEGQSTGNARIYFPKMTNLTNGNIMLKLAVALDNMDVDAQLNIPRSIINDIVNIVVQKYAPQPVSIEEKIK